MDDRLLHEPLVLGALVHHWRREDGTGVCCHFRRHEERGTRGRERTGQGATGQWHPARRGILGPGVLVCGSYCCRRLPGALPWQRQRDHSNWCGAGAAGGRPCTSPLGCALRQGPREEVPWYVGRLRAQRYAGLRAGTVLMAMKTILTACVLLTSPTSATVSHIFCCFITWLLSTLSPELLGILVLSTNSPKPPAPLTFIDGCSLYPSPSTPRDRCRMLAGAVRAGRVGWPAGGRCTAPLARSRLARHDSRWGRWRCECPPACLGRLPVRSRAHIPDTCALCMITCSAAAFARSLCCFLRFAYACLLGRWFLIFCSGGGYCRSPPSWICILALCRWAASLSTCTEPPQALACRTCSQGMTLPLMGKPAHMPVPLRLFAPNAHLHRKIRTPHPTHA